MPLEIVIAIVRCQSGDQRLFGTRDLPLNAEWMKNRQDIHEPLIDARQQLR